MHLPEDVERAALIGWHLYPCSRKTKAACFKGATDKASCDLDTLAGWVREFGACNWRVVCGPSRIWAIDVDVPGADHKADGMAAMADLVCEHGALPRGPRTRSGGGGVCVIFRHNGEPINGKTGYPRLGLDPRRGRLSFTVPPSVHITTHRPYVWLATPWDVAPPAAPSWLLQACAPPPEPPRPAIPTIATTDVARRILTKATHKVSVASAGQRNDTLNGQGYFVGRFVAAGLLSEFEASEALYAAARQAGLPHLEIKETLKSAFRSASRNPAEVMARGRYAA